MPNIPVTALLDQAAARFGRRTALVFFGRRTSYRALARSAECFAAGLAGLGVRAGDRVALIMPNCPQFVTAYYGTLRLGAVAVPVDPRYTRSELQRQLVDSGAVVAVVYDGAYEKVASVRPHCVIRHVVSASLSDELPLRLRWLLRMPLARSRALCARLGVAGHQTADAVPYTRLLRSRPTPGRRAEDVPANRAAVLQYTGGTTGASKGVMLSHRNLVANAHQIRSWYPQLRDGRETWIAVLPFCHLYGLTLALHVGVLAGARMVLHPDSDAESLLRSARRWKPTFLAGVPQAFDALLGRPAEEREALRPLRICVSGRCGCRPRPSTASGPRPEPNSSRATG
ncbi:AMP-binding protein [Streptomyces sp. NPDC019443]|uniref:AMP-binding protein n=1 Tax=Streptomyces sp. NPDC019443 TaxID=3365061 RepID=UPI0037A96301